MPALYLPGCFFLLRSLKVIVFSPEHTTDWHLVCSSSPRQHKPCIPRRDDSCSPLPTGTDRQQTEGPFLFLLWFLAASVRFLGVYHCNQQARPTVSQAAWNKAVRTTEHKVGEAFGFGYWEEESAFSQLGQFSGLCHQRTVLVFRDKPTAA